MTSRRGSAVFGWILAIAASSTAFLFMMLTQMTKQNSLANKDVFEAGIMVATHSLASQFKAVLLNNYNAYVANTANGWNTCTHGPSSVADFIAVLSSPPASCTTVKFILSASIPSISFETTDPTPVGWVTLAAFKGTKVVPKKDINNIRTSLTLEDFNIARNQLITSVALDYRNSARNIASSRSMRQVIDLARTLNPPPNEVGCHLCRAVPGSVCCPSQVNITYIDGGGKVMQAEWDKTTATLTQTALPGLTPDPKAVGAKNLSASGGTLYLGHSFCLQGLGSCPPATRYLVDVALKGMDAYYITGDGRIISDAINPAIHLDPRWRSIGFDNDVWYLLRSGGAIFETQDIEDPATYREIVGLRLPTAAALTMGSAPPPIP